jgi:hypothetical protein
VVTVGSASAAWRKARKSPTSEEEAGLSEFMTALKEVPDPNQDLDKAQMDWKHATTWLLSSWTFIMHLHS